MTRVRLATVLIAPRRAALGLALVIVGGIAPRPRDATKVSTRVQQSVCRSRIIFCCKIKHTSLG
jgi:hypothetical protein